MGSSATPDPSIDSIVFPSGNKKKENMPYMVGGKVFINPPADDTNPKDLLGDKKPDLSLVPPAAIIYMALAMQNGAAKYGPYNWRDKKVKARVYVSACKRHIDEWLDGEELAPDSLIPHIGHAMACLGILADAIETDSMIDDRPLPGAASRLIEKWTKK